MQIELDAIHRQIGVTQFEEALLEDYAENFFAQEFLRSATCQICRQCVPGFDLSELVSRWRGREFKKVERTFDCVDGEEARLVFAAEVVVHAVEMEGDVDFGNAAAVKEDIAQAEEWRTKAMGTRRANEEKKDKGPGGITMDSSGNLK